MVEETETKSFAKEFGTAQSSSDATDAESTGTWREGSADAKTINYFSMTEEDILKERNKIKDDSDDLFKDINANDRNNLRRSDEHGWDEEDLNILI